MTSVHIFNISPWASWPQNKYIIIFFYLKCEMSFPILFHLPSLSNNNMANLWGLGVQWRLTEEIHEELLEWTVPRQWTCNSWSRNRSPDMRAALCMKLLARGWPRVTVHQGAGRLILPKDTLARIGHSDCQKFRLQQTASRFHNTARAFLPSRCWGQL